MNWLGTLFRALSFLKLAWPKLIELVVYCKKRIRENKLRKAMKDVKANNDTRAIEEFLVSRGMHDKSNKAKRDTERRRKDSSERPDSGT